MLPLLIGAPVVVATVLIQGFGSMALVRLLFRYLVTPAGDLPPGRALATVILTALGLLWLHCLQIYVWALVYFWLPSVTVIDTIEEATYFSAVTFTTVGYGDITLTAAQGRLLAGVEALNGVLLLGWSTALLFAVVQRTWGAFMQRKPWFKPLAEDQAPVRHRQGKPPHSG
ncbi:potassium channel family protein [Rhabdochromatium marinum]|uniref:potassium channel family protein n=1 Tax=Rhabdochromatium marinum TaxID=48729 RepID=UPI001F5B38B8|nr:potassium channel family protein [Rhabdochromatium marinum]